MDRRAVKHYRVMERAKKHSYGLSSPKDFTLLHRRDVDRVALPESAVPYCTDLSAERLWFTVVDDPAAALSAPFVYRALYERATNAVSVPIERCRELAVGSAVAPLLVFSIGRCGSTLLSALLNAAGYVSLSEPDCVCQFAFLKSTQLAHAGRPLVDAALRTSVGWLERQGGSAVAVKFRSQCNRAVDLYRQALPGARFVFMLRDKASWVLSVNRAFSEPAAVVAERLRTGIVAFDRMVESGCDPVLIWYHDLQERPHQAVESLLGKPLDFGMRAAVDLAMQKDSQAGTGLDRHLVRNRQSDEEILKGFETAWRQSAPYPLIEKHGFRTLL